MIKVSKIRTIKATQARINQPINDQPNSVRLQLREGIKSFKNLIDQQDIIYGNFP